MVWLWDRSLNDHEELRRDPLLAVLAGKRRLEEPWRARAP